MCAVSRASGGDFDSAANNTVDISGDPDPQPCRSCAALPWMICLPKFCSFYWQAATVRWTASAPSPTISSATCRQVANALWRFAIGCIGRCRFDYAEGPSYQDRNGCVHGTGGCVPRLPAFGHHADPGNECSCTLCHRSSRRHSNSALRVRAISRHGTRYGSKAGGGTWTPATTTRALGAF